MYCKLSCTLLLAALAVATSHAQEHKLATQAASDATAPVPEARYQSAFDGYKPYREQKLAPWRELNDEVHKAGGHVGIFGGNAGGASGTTGKPAPSHPAGHKK